MSDEKVSALSLPAAATPSSRRAPSRGGNNGDDGVQVEKGGGPLSSIKSFRRKKYVRQRLSPLESDTSVHLSLLPTATAPAAMCGANNSIEDDDDDDEIDRLQRFHAMLASDAAIDQWVRTYEGEKQQFASFAVFAETKLDEIQDAYVGLVGRPNAVEVAACVASLLKMPGIVGCYTSLLDKLAVGLQSAIYLPPDDGDPSILNTASSSMAALVRGCYHRKTYFAHVRELEHQLMDNRSLNDTSVLRSLTVDEVIRVLVQVPLEQLRLGLHQVCCHHTDVFDQLLLFMQEEHTEQQRRQQLRPSSCFDEDEDALYPVHVPLTSSAQICRAISRSASSFSASGKEMIMCSILEHLDVESFKDVFKRFDAHGKALFLHHLSVTESTDHLQSIVEQLEPNAGEMLFRFYFVSCGAHGDPSSGTKQVFFKKLLSPEIEYFFLCDVAAYLNDEQFLLLSKEYEKHVLERKRRRRTRRRSSFVSGDDDTFNDDLDDDDDDDDAAGNGAKRSDKSSLDHFQLMIWNYVHHHRLTSAQVFSIIATVLQPSLETPEFASLLDFCMEHFEKDGASWLQLLRIVEEMDADHGALAPTSNTTSDNNVRANIGETRLKLLKKLFSMLSREERESLLDKMNAKYPTESWKRRLQSLKREASKSVVVASTTSASPPPISMDDPKVHIAQMKMELKMLWMECLLEAITSDKEYSARMSMLKQVLQPFLDGKAPSASASAHTAMTKPSVVTVEKNVHQLLAQLSTAEKAKLLLKLAPPPLPEVRPTVARATSPIPESQIVEQPPQIVEQPPQTVEQPPPPAPKTSPPLFSLPKTTNPEILSAFDALLEHKTDEQVLEILRNALSRSEEVTHENVAVPVAHQPPDSAHSEAVVTNGMKRKLSAVVAVSDPMEWQEYVKLGCMDVGCQTNFEDELQASTAAPSSTVNTAARISVLPNKLLPLTLTSLLGKAPGTPRRKGETGKYQKLNSAAVPRALGGLITSWRMNTDQLVQFAKKSISAVLKIIADAYGELLTAGRRKQQQNPNFAPPTRGAGGTGRELTLAQVVYQQFLHSYGLPGIADMHLLAFAIAIELYRTQHLRVEYFARFCFEEVPKLELTNYLEFLECIVCDDAAASNNSSLGNAGASNALRGQQQMQSTKRSRFTPRIIVPDKENWTISVDKAQEAVQLCFRAMRKSSVLAFCDRLVVLAAMGTSSSSIVALTTESSPSMAGPQSNTSDLVLNVDHLLQLVAHEWRDEQQRRDTHLLEAFRAGDVNGDGELTSAEFSQIVLSIDRGRDLGDILLMYSETLRRTECDHINTQVFLQVAKEYELDRVVWSEDGDLRNIVNDISDLDATWHLGGTRSFFLGTLEALTRDLVSTHFLRVCEGAGCGCLKCILDGYIGFQKMRRDFVLSQQQQQGTTVNDSSTYNPYTVVSESLVWARYWHLMRQLYEAASESDGILTPWEGSDYMRMDAVPPPGPRFVSQRRCALPNFLFPDTNRISAKLNCTVHDPEVFDAPAINAQFANLLEFMSYKKS